MNEFHCKPFLCKYKAHSLSEWRKAALNKKKELQNAGIIAFEAHPEYKNITKCKPDDNNFPSKSWCDKRFGSWSDENQESPKQASPPGKQASPKQASPKQASPKQASPPSKKASTPSKKASTGKRARCKNGTRFNKKTQNCQQKNNRSSPPSKRASTPSKKANTGKRARCKNGTRFNKKTQNCKPN
jgi:hypothetical protein